MLLPLLTVVVAGPVTTLTRSETILLAAVGALLALVAVTAYVIRRSIVSNVGPFVTAAGAITAGNLSQRVPISGDGEFSRLGLAFNEMADHLQGRLEGHQESRRRLRDSTIRFGEALVATDDVDQLLRSLAETAVELTRADGGRIVSADGDAVEVGDPDAGPHRLELPLRVGDRNFGALVLRGPELTIQDLEAASLLVGHAVIALENARLHRLLERQALVDELTGLPNRRAAEQTLADEFARANRFGSPVGLVFADLDGFKSINDRFGHPSGDLVLREFAAVLGVTIREIDLAARWGGEEFCLILPGTDAAGAERLAERLREALAERTILSANADPVHVTASFGVASHPPSGTAEGLIAAADAALYEAKRAGKDRVAVAATRVATG